MSTTPNRRALALRIDWLTILLFFILALTGILAIYSVEYTSFEEPFFNLSKNHMRQLIWLGISLLIGTMILMTDSKFFFNVAYLSFFLGFLFLLSTFVLGSNVKGSNSFIKIGTLTIQPGEIMKVFTSLAIARFIATTDNNFSTLRERLIASVFAFVPLIIILAQNETGLALVYFAFIIPMYREGLPSWILMVGIGGITLLLAALLVKQWPLFFIISGITVVAILVMMRQIRRQPRLLMIALSTWALAVVFTNVVVPITFKHVFHSYQVERIYTMLGQEVPDEFLKPGQEAASNVSDYNVRQAKIAIGSGGFWGKGFMKGTQTKYSFVPEQNTDFVFCGIGEQFGFVGSTLLILVYTLLLFRIIQLAERQRSTFSRVYAYSVAGVLFFHLAVNLSMNLGLAPVIGITLPLISYGGTSLLAFSIMLFILIRLDADRHLLIR